MLHQNVKQHEVNILIVNPSDTFLLFLRYIIVEDETGRASSSIISLIPR